ncbi:MAG: DUF58 domain-containing protein [Candidatus Marinimicrobia bacterium]|nr:DUF58 domain-containing protein [Candidatus Neomarinimicrobiota bacterium]
MIPKEILKKVKRIEIQTRKIVNEVFSGEYRSIFKGRGMSFSEVREYRRGDDVRMIDWNVTARQNHPYIKVMEEERELTVYFVVDISYSGHFGSVEQYKSEIAAEICSVLSFSAIKNNDKVGLLTFSDEVEKYISPRKGKSNGLRVIREILYNKSESGKTDIGNALGYLSKIINKKSVIFVVSDFYDLDFEKSLKVLSNRHDVILIHMIDPFDKVLPNIGLMSFRDAETDEKQIIDTDNKNNQSKYTAQFLKRQSDLEQIVNKSNVDLLNIETDKPYTIPLTKFFKKRGKMFH